MKRLMHLNRRKALMIGGLCVLAVVVFVLWPKELGTMSSLPFIRELPGPENRRGRFRISNTGSNQVTIQVIGAEVWSNGVWNPAPLARLDFQMASPGDIFEFDIDPPNGPAKWRGVVLVQQEAHGLTSLILKAKILWQYRNLIPRGERWILWKGTISTSQEVVTQEITP
jgi:hypothetical protein